MTDFVRLRNSPIDIFVEYEFMEYPAANEAV